VQRGENLVRLVGVLFAQGVEVEPSGANLRGEEFERFYLGGRQSKLPEASGGSAADGVVVKWIVRNTQTIPDRVRAGRRQLLSDYDSRETGKSRLTFAQRRHTGGGEDRAQSRIPFYQCLDRAFEVGLRLEATRRGFWQCGALLSCFAFS
jgi:hypothetical protein